MPEDMHMMSISVKIAKPLHRNGTPSGKVQARQ